MKRNFSKFDFVVSSRIAAESAEPGRWPLAGAANMSRKVGESR